MAKGYTTRQEVENYLLITIDASFYAQITAWIEAVEAYIEKATDRIFVADTLASARLYDGNGSSELIVDDSIQITKIEIGSDDDGWTEMTEYFLYPANRLPKRRIKLDGDIFTCGNQNVKITAKWGYVATVPADIKFAATVLLAGIINFSNDAEGEVASMTVGSYSVSYKDREEKADLERAMKILQSYKKYTF